MFTFDGIVSDVGGDCLVRLSGETENLEAILSIFVAYDTTKQYFSDLYSQ